MKSTTFPVWAVAAAALWTSSGAGAEEQSGRVGEPGAVTFRIARPAEGVWVVRTPAGTDACSLPCEVAVDDRSGWSVVRIPDGQSADLPRAATFAAGSITDMQVSPSRGSYAGATVLTLASLALIAVGAVELAQPCQPGDYVNPAACFAGVAVGVGVAGAIGGIAWYVYTRGAQVEVPHTRTDTDLSVSGRAKTPRVSWTGNAVAVVVRY